MTKDEALKLALDELCAYLDFPERNPVVKKLKAVLAQTAFLSTNEADIDQLIEERDVREVILDKVLDMVLGIDRPEWSSSYKYIDAVEDVCEALAQPERDPWREAVAQPEERNFCPRCGKRTADLTTIHTCTPPQGNT